MAQPHHDDEIFKNKRIRKNPINFKISLNEEQKKAKEKILSNTLTVLSGKAGSGKTLLACQIALDYLFTNRAERIVITRPTVSKEDIGFLPGDLREKMDPWLQPIYQNMFMLYDKNKIQKEFDEEHIMIVPVAFMRGNTFTNSVIIVDEAQNVTNDQMEMILGRIGNGSIMIVCGDEGQIDLRHKKDSGFKLLYTFAKKVKGMVAITLKENHRHEIVESILQVYEEAREGGLINDKN